MLRILRLACLLALAAPACGAEDGGSATTRAGEEAKNPPGIAITTCGVLRRYEPPAPERAGTLGVDARWWVIAPHGVMENPEDLVPGSALCVSMLLDSWSRIEHCTAFLDEAL